MQISDKNIKIAEFMGWEEKYHPVQQINTSWDWLVPVVERIEYKHDNKVTICMGKCKIQPYNFNCESLIGKVFEHKADTKIEAVHEACYLFITSLNK